MDIPKKRSGASRKGTSQKLKEKKCQFPECGVIFIGRGKAKYCDEHRKAKYRKDLYKLNDNEGEAITNIPHEFVYATEMERECGLKGCNTIYRVNLLPRLFDYPNFCNEHRNQYKRQRFIDQLKEDDDESMGTDNS